MRDPDPNLPGRLYFRDERGCIPPYRPGPPQEGLAVGPAPSLPFEKGGDGRKLGSALLLARAKALLPFGLGVESDSEVGRRTGLTSNTVKRYRELLGLPPARPRGFQRRPK